MVWTLRLILCLVWKHHFSKQLTSNSVHPRVLLAYCNTCVLVVIEKAAKYTYINTSTPNIHGEYYNELHINHQNFLSHKGLKFFIVLVVYWVAIRWFWQQLSNVGSSLRTSVNATFKMQLCILTGSLIVLVHLPCPQWLMHKILV